MSNADVNTTTTDEFASNMARVIRSLMSREDMSVGALRSRLGMPSNTWAQRMKRGNWSARDLAGLSQALNCGVGDLFADPDDIGVRQNWKILNSVPSDGDPETTPPVRGHLHPVP